MLLKQSVTSYKQNKYFLLTDHQLPKNVVLVHTKYGSYEKYGRKNDKSQFVTKFIAVRVRIIFI